MKHRPSSLPLHYYAPDRQRASLQRSLARSSPKGLSNGVCRYEIFSWLDVHLSISSFQQPVMRRIVTRLLGLIPALIVAVALGRPGIDALLVASQVVLSIVLPFVVFPLIYLSSSPAIMGVNKPREPAARCANELPSNIDLIVSEKHEEEEQTYSLPSISLAASNYSSGAAQINTTGSVTEEERRPDDLLEVLAQGDDNCLPCGLVLHEGDAEADTLDFSNGRVLIFLGYLTWAVVVIANAYALVELALGNVGT
jgi:metal iron transporter